MADNKISRRSIIKGAAVGAGAVIAGGITGCGDSADASKTKGKKLKNEDFYKNGVFQPEVAKEAYFEMFRSFNYPIYKQLKTDQFWAIDFGIGNFVEVGMAGIFWFNSHRDRYFGHEIYLLPNQMIAEHAHVKTKIAPCKMEGWQVRHGSIYNFGEGKANIAEVGVKLPEKEKKFITSPHVELVEIGGLRHLETPESKHFMMGGPKGAIVTEYANFHDNNGLRFTNPGAKL